MGMIPLSKAGLFAVVDDEDHERVSRFLWHPKRGGHGGTVYAAAVVHRKKIPLHRLIEPDAPMVDHINGDGLDCRRCNLRPCTPAQNSRNARKRSGFATSRFKGVSWVKRRRKWMARICYVPRMPYMQESEA